MSTFYNFFRKRGIFSSPVVLYSIAIILGIATGFSDNKVLLETSSLVSELFISLLKLVSIPILFLSILTVASSMENSKKIALLGKKVLTYTIFTTVFAASCALLFFLLIDPVKESSLYAQGIEKAPVGSFSGYAQYLIEAVPSNIIQPFVSNNILGVLFLAFIFSLGMFAISYEERNLLHKVFSSCYAVFMHITSFIVRAIPFALWAFVALFVRDVEMGLELKAIGLYLICVVAANLFQGFVVLPLFLKYHKISPLALAQAMLPALTMAFFTKSSSATVPTAIRAAQDRAHIDPKIAGFTFPLCTTINMNGCAAFILITVLFVSQLEGMTFQGIDFFLWIFIATIAAVGNAGVPMGCFFLASAFLAAMNVPVNVMGIILPFYALIDAIETAVNVWSDCCIAKILDSKAKEAFLEFDQKLTSPLSPLN